MALHLVTGYEGAEHIQSVDQGSFNIAAFGGGQFVLDHGNKFEATLISGNTVRIKDGDLLMQGRHMRLAAGTTEEVTVDSGTAGKMRNDLVCARYTRNSSTGVELGSFVVIKGTEVASNPQDPAYNTGTITDGNDLTNDFPLYRVSLNGTDATLSEPLFAVSTKVSDAIETVEEVADDMADVKAAIAKDFILINKQNLTFSANVCTISDARITADSLADVYFTTACMTAAEKAAIVVETSAGAVTLTAGRTPESTLTATIKIRVV